MPLRILVVDDFDPFRRYLRSALKQEIGFKIIGEASDGLDAVQKAIELQPDLILLDMGLPKLSGLEAAKRIRALAPSAKILIISQESSFDVIEAALRLGVRGYVHKLHAGRELLPALEAVSREAYFVSSVLKGNSREPDHGPPARHEAQFYSGDALLVEGFTDFAVEHLQAGKAVIMAVTEPHRAGVLHGLNARSVNVDQAMASGTLIVVDAVDTLSRLMNGEVLDPDQFFDVIGELIETASRAVPRLAVCGEVALQLLAAGKTAQALRLEQLLDVVVHSYGFDTLCGYSLEFIDSGSDAFRSLCAEHLSQAEEAATSK